MQFTERWYRLLVRVFPEAESGSRRDEIVTTLRDTGRLDATIPSVRESISLVKAGYQLRTGSSSEPLKPVLLSGLALGSVLYLGFVWVRHLIALQRSVPWGYEAGLTDWIIVALPVFVVLAAAPIRLVRLLSASVFGILLVLAVDPSISAIPDFGNRHWLTADLYLLFRFAAPVAVVAFASQAVASTAGPAISYTTGSVIGWVLFPGTMFLLPDRGETALMMGAFLVVWAVITPAPLLAAITAATFVGISQTIRGGPDFSVLPVLAIVWLATFVVIFAVRLFKQHLVSSRPARHSRQA